MSMFRVLQTWMVHEGGTKFYQVFSVAHADNPRTIAVFTNWGPTKGDDKWTRVVERGQVKLDIETSGISFIDAHTQAVHAKLKRGYETRSKTGTYDAGAIFMTRTELIEQLGRSRVDNMLVKMGLTIDGEVPDADALADSESPSPEREDTPIDKFAGRPAAWGAW